MRSSGYWRLPLRYTKLYVAIVEDGSGKRRALRKQFKRARDAVDYAEDVAERWNRMRVTQPEGEKA